MKAKINSKSITITLSRGEAFLLRLFLRNEDCERDRAEFNKQKRIEFISLLESCIDNQALKQLKNQQGRLKLWKK